jgi:hypothetical protein
VKPVITRPVDMDRLAALSKPRAIEPAEEENQIVVKKKSVKPPMPPSST